jgi:hypothetical protein
MSSELSQFLNASVDFGGGAAHGVSAVAKVTRVDAETTGDVGNGTAARGAGTNSDAAGDDEVASTAKAGARAIVSAPPVDNEIAAAAAASATVATVGGKGNAAVAAIGVVDDIVDAAVVDTGDAVVAVIDDSAVVVVVVVVVVATANVDAEGIAATIAATGDASDAAIVDAAMMGDSARPTAVVAAIVVAVEEGAAAKAAAIVIAVALSADVVVAAIKDSPVNAVVAAGDPAFAAVGAAAVVEASRKNSLTDEVAPIFARFTGVGLFALVGARFVKRTVPGAVGEAGGAPQLPECKAPDDAFAADASTLPFAPTSPSGSSSTPPSSSLSTAASSSLSFAPPLPPLAALLRTTAAKPLTIALARSANDTAPLDADTVASPIFSSIVTKRSTPDSAVLAFFERAIRVRTAASTASRGVVSKPTPVITRSAAIATSLDDIDAARLSLRRAAAMRLAASGIFSAAMCLSLKNICVNMSNAHKKITDTVLSVDRPRVESKWAVTVVDTLTTRHTRNVACVRREICRSSAESDDCVAFTLPFLSSRCLLGFSCPMTIRSHEEHVTDRESVCQWRLVRASCRFL